MKKISAIIAMLCITALELAALQAGINGLLFSIAIGAIAGLGGFVIGTSNKGK